MAIRNPVIPTEITVHLGPPDMDAKNITIPFQEYIKNVASSEIYPNWPLDAIKANILAQISFALNRIYNEWYPSQGYNFDITNDPAYDQNFTENGQFFENISHIVDDVFNNYIVKDGQVQPLFAVYCDGRNSTCEGLSQWGSVELAERGLSPIEILKTYYGDDIKIVYNAPVDANIMSYPNFPIRLGYSGDFVRILKIQLNRISENYPTIPLIADDSVYFTTDLEEAVKAFQKIFSLPETGVVDKSTWYKIKYIYNAVKQISDIYSEGISLEEATLVFDKELTIGSTGPHIRTLNYLLDFIAYFNPNIPFVSLSGTTYNEKTEQAVKAFQKEYKILETGIVDSNTWRAILEAYEQTQKTIPSEYLVYVDEFYPGIFLSRGMQGEDVVRLQNFLYKICENTHEIPGVRVNGIFDSLTEQSILYIQRKYKEEETAVVTPSLWKIIVAWSKGEAPPIPS